MRDRDLVAWVLAVCFVFTAWFELAFVLRAHVAPPTHSGVVPMQQPVCEPRIVTETKVVKVPVVEVEKVIDHRVPASVKRELRALRHRVWVDKQNLATAYLPR